MTLIRKLLDIFCTQNKQTIIFIISYKLTLNKHLTSSDIIKELNVQTRSETSNSLLATIYKMFTENDLDEVCLQIDALTEKQAKYIENFQNYYNDLKAQYKVGKN